MTGSPARVDAIARSDHDADALTNDDYVSTLMSNMVDRRDIDGI